jgi:hypothetical protein
VTTIDMGASSECCDFCSDPIPVEHFVWEGKTQAVLWNGETQEHAVINLGTEWNACTGCAVLVRQLNPVGLAARVKREFVRKGNFWVDEMGRELLALYTGLMSQPYSSVVPLQ